MIKRKYSIKLLAFLTLTIFISQSIVTSATAAGISPPPKLYAVGFHGNDEYGYDGNFAYSRKVHEPYTWSDQVSRMSDVETNIMLGQGEFPVGIGVNPTVTVQSFVSVRPDISYYTISPNTYARRYGVYKVEFKISVTGPNGQSFNLDSANWKFNEGVSWSGSHKPWTQSVHNITLGTSEEYGLDDNHGYLPSENLDHLVAGAALLKNKIPYGNLLAGGLIALDRYQDWRYDFSNDPWTAGHSESAGEVSTYMRVPLNDFNDVDSDYVFDTVGFTAPLDLSWGVSGYYIIHLTTEVTLTRYETDQWQSHPYMAWQEQGFLEVYSSQQDIGIGIGQNARMIDGIAIGGGGSVLAYPISNAWITNIGEGQQWVLLNGGSSQVQLTASISSGYEFVRWQDANGNLISTSVTITITGNDGFGMSDQLYVYYAIFQAASSGGGGGGGGGSCTFRCLTQ
ncbi:MAG: hypothetical protein IH840_13480 [Candidatus Heimdallarchaeota archaeon]|nr:hypothetical protein [Candidatus Heimdallarchaeota archaeon]